MSESDASFAVSRTRHKGFSTRAPYRLALSMHICVESDEKINF